MTNHFRSLNAVIVVRTVTTIGDAGVSLHRLFTILFKWESRKLKSKLTILLALTALVVVSSVGCATKKYVRNRVSERVTPLEHRTGELEETSRRNTQDISRLSTDITEVRGRADRAQSQADTALTRADEANTRVTGAEQSVTDLRANLDSFTLQNTASVRFDFDSYELTPEAKEALDQLASQIKDRDNFILEIQGFADWIGSDAYNNQLTQRRANAVRRYIAEQHDIALFRMHILGFGKIRPVADNKTPEGRAENRRVEIRLLTRNIGGASTARVKTAAQP
jgi:outer membrane protein OmpA-like peptidoglycan-associated protein